MINLYTLPRCSHCKEVKGKLDKAGIAWSEIDLTTSEADLHRVKAAGITSAPAIETEDGTLHKHTDIDAIIEARKENN